MKIAIPCWRGRVSPVFDVCGNILIVEIGAGGESRDSREVACGNEGWQGRVALLVRNEVKVLVCGAISWPLATAVSAAGIEVISQVCGDVDQVLAAFREGRLGQGGFLMPGCRGQQHQFRGGRGGRGRGFVGGGRGRQL